MAKQPIRLTRRRAVGKRAAEPLRGPQSDQVAGAGAGSPREANPEEPFHAALPFFRPRRGRTHSHGCP